MNEKKKIIRILIEKLEIRPNMANIPPFIEKKFERTHINFEGVYLYCEGKTNNGKLIHFFTEQCVIKKCTGVEKYERIDKNPGNFFHEEVGEIIGHEKQIIGKKVIYPYIEDCTKVIPLIKIGDLIVLNFTDSKEVYESNLLLNVELLPQF